MKRRIGMAAAAIVVAWSLGTAGCGSSDCEKFYDKLKQCNKEFADVPKGEFIKLCEEQKKNKPEEFKEELGCISKGSCEEYMACQTAQENKRRVERLMKSVEEAKASKKWDDVVSDCRYHKELLAENAEAKAACTEVLGLAYGDMVKMIEGKRDAGERAFRECLDLKDIAEMIGGEAPAQTATLCAEADAGERAGEALKEAKANVDAKTADLPVSCSMAMKELEKVTSEWGKQKTAEVAKACYLDLGKVIMAAKLPDMKYTCGYHVGEVYKAVKQYELADPEMDAFMAKAAKLCDKK